MENYTLSHSAKGYGKRYSKTYSLGYYFMQWIKIEKPVLIEILKKNKIQENSAILDFACGTGRIMLALKERGFKNLLGIDVSEEMLSQARLVDYSLNLVNMDITKHETRHYINTFDLITSFRFFTNAVIELRAKVLVKLTQFLKPKGLLVVNFHQNSQSILGQFYSLRNFLTGKKIANIFSTQDAILLFKSYGFELVEIQYYSIFPRLSYMLDKFNFLLKILMLSSEKTYNFLRLPQNYKQSFILVLKKS